jgi:hypothetical protein
MVPALAGAGRRVPLCIGCRPCAGILIRSRQDELVVVQSQRDDTRRDDESQSSQDQHTRDTAALVVGPLL